MQTYSAFGCCFFWLLNSALGLYVLTQYPHLHDTHEEIYTYLLYFSSKWIIALFSTLALLLFIQLLMKLCCCAKSVCHNTIGSFPMIYLMIISISYLYSLYYGVIILKEMYTEDPPLSFPDPFEFLLLKVFVFNEVLTGAILILQFIQLVLCGKVSKSQHLNEIEGEGFGVDENEVARIREELEQSRIKSEMQLKGVQGAGQTLSDIEVIKVDARNASEDIEMVKIQKNPQ